MSSSKTQSISKIRVGIFFGGRSAEHEVSINSAKNVIEALDKTKFTPILIGIDQNGGWHHIDTPHQLEEAAKALESSVQSTQKSFNFSSDSTNPSESNIDVVFPILHGPYGEDGTIQGVLEIAGIPYVGPGVLSSAINMDKDISKRLLKAAGIPVAPYLTNRSHEQRITFQVALDTLSMPVFIKPANMGSSIGVSKAETEDEFNSAVKKAFEYDSKILIEGAITGEEIECSVLGNESPKASVIGRITTNNAKFYDYSAKYIDENGAVLEIPAKVDNNITEAARAMAIKAYTTLECEGLSRVDMFATADGAIVVNELNTIPGFTNISMYPKLWEASGLSYTDLITELIELAIERHKKRSHLKTLPT